MAVIYITRKDGTRQKYRLPAEPGSIISIGRDASCVVSMPDVVGLSGRHCTIRREGQVYVIADNHSTNGTLCDGEPITESVMRRSAVYSLGEATLVFDPEISAAPKIDLAALSADERREEEQAREDGKASPSADKSSSEETSPRAGEPEDASEARDKAFATSGSGEGSDIRRGVASGDSSSRHADAAPEGTGSASESKLPAVPQGPSLRTDDAPSAPRLRVPAGARRRARGAHPVAEAAAPRSGLVRMLIGSYVLLVLGGAFYAGLTLRHWWETGRYLPTDGAAGAVSPSTGEPLVSPALSTPAPTAPAPASPAAGAAATAPVSSGDVGSAAPQGTSAAQNTTAGGAENNPVRPASSAVGATPTNAPGPTPAPTTSAAPQGNGNNAPQGALPQGR